MSDISAFPTAELVEGLIQQEAAKSELNGELLSAFNGYVTSLSVLPYTELNDRLEDIQFSCRKTVECPDGEVVVDRVHLMSKDVPIAETDKKFWLTTDIQLPVDKIPNPDYDDIDEVPADVLAKSIADARSLGIYIVPKDTFSNTGSAELEVIRNDDVDRPISVSYRDKTPASQEHVVLATRLLSLGATALSDN